MAYLLHKSNVVRRFAPVLLLVALGGCEEPPAGPDPTWRSVAQIFADHSCNEANCHNADTVAGELNLTGLGAYDELVDVPCANDSAGEDGQKRVSPGNPDASFLQTKLELIRADEALGLPMPPVGPGLSDEELDAVRAWIQAGADRQ